VSQPNPSVEEHVKSLFSLDAVARRRGREELVKIGTPAVGAIVELLKHPQQHVRWEACKTLEGIAHPSAATSLVEALADVDKDVCWVAGAALIPLGRDGLEPLLVALMEKKRVAGLQPGAHHVAHEWVRGELAEILAPLLEALSGPEAELAVPVAAEKVLHQIRSA
jgi:HEAT repeat protein